MRNMKRRKADRKERRKSHAKRKTNRKRRKFDKTKIHDLKTQKALRVMWRSDRDTYHTTLIGKDGKSVSVNVVAVVQKDDKRVTYKIVTVYLDKKEK